MKRFILLVVLLILMIGGWYGYKEYHRTNKDLSEVQAAVTINAESLIAAFEKDSAAANQQYLGKVIAVRGPVQSIEEQSATVVLGRQGSLSAVRCSMDTAHLQELKQVQEGQLITIKGVCTGYNADALLGADVFLNRCVVQTNKNE